MHAPWLRPAAGALAVATMTLASTPRPAAHQQAPLFMFESRAWVNLHHFLYVLGRATTGVPDTRRAAVIDAPKDSESAALTPEERRVWTDAVTRYAATLSKQDLVFDAPLIAVTNALARTADTGAVTDSSVPADIRAALAASMPIYQRRWWPAHSDANRRRIAGFERELDRHGRAIATRVSQLWGESWPPAGVRVQVAAYVSWSGAYSTRGPLLVVGSLASAHDGSSGLEILFHEAMHQWDDQMEARLRKAAARAGASVPGDLSHAMIFYTAGYVTRAVVGDSHTPYAEANGIWQRSLGRYRAALDAHWKPYLEGTTTMDEALVNLVRALVARQTQRQILCIVPISAACPVSHPLTSSNRTTGFGLFTSRNSAA